MIIEFVIIDGQYD